MTLLRHHIISACLIVLIALTAQSAAVARMMPNAAGEMVICTGTGPVTLYTDDSGTPTDAPHLCPDCTLSLLVALPEQSLVLAAPDSPQQRVTARDVHQTPLLPLGVPQARGPPRLI